MNEKEPSRLSTIVNSFFNIIPIGLSFLMPVLFLSVTSEFYEFNKLMLLALSTLLLLLAWVFKMVESKRISFTKSSIDFPLVLLTITLILSTIFSINKTTSIFGSQGRWYPSLFGGLVIYVFFYLISGNLSSRNTIKHSLIALLGGITLSSFVAILSYYKIYLGSEPYFKLTNFSLTGSITTTVVLAALGTVLAAASLLYEESIQKKAFLLVATVVNYFLVVLVSIIPGWVVLGVGLISIVFFVSYKKIMENTVFLTMAAGTLAAITLVVFLPTTRELITTKGYPKELVLPVRESWIVASEAVQDYPTLATGPSTFGLNFPRYRPLSLNSGDFWNVRFDRPYNAVFDVLATLGIVGLLAVSYFAFRAVKLIFIALKTHDDDGLSKILGISALSIMVVFLVTYATVLNTYVFMLLFAFVLISLSANKSGGVEHTSVRLSNIAPVTTIGEEGAIKKEYIQYVLALPVVAIMGYTGFLMYKFYAGEVYLRASVIAATKNEGAKTFEYQTKAINMNPRRDSYHNAYAQTNLALANSIASKEELTDTDRQTIQQLIAQSIRNARLSTEVLNPLNVDNWSTRASIYRAISPVAQNASQWAIASYNTAIQLSPTDPRLRLDIGGIYYANGDYLTAANFYRQAILLKQNYANAHFNFAQALIKLEDYNNARRALEVTRTLVDKNSNDYKLVEEQLANLPKAPQQSDLPTVEQIEQSGKKEETAPTTPAQEPLKTVGEEEKVEGGENLEAEVLPNETTPATTETAQPAEGTQPAQQ